MGKIVTSTQSLFEHYCKMQYLSSDLPHYITVSITGALTGTPAFFTMPTFTANQWLFASVDSIVPIPADMTVTLKTGSASVKIPAGAGLDSCWLVTSDGTLTGSKDMSAVGLTSSPTITVTGGVSGVRLSFWVMDAPTHTTWLDLGQNFTESLSWNIGPTTAYVPRGWSATDHSKRIRNINNFTMRQMYCSNMEGVANLRGMTVLIMDQIFTDGGSVAKEMYLVTKCQFNNVTVNTGGMGGETMADTVDANGVFSRKFVFTFDSTSIAAGYGS